MMLAKSAFVLWLSEFPFINSHLYVVAVFVCDRGFLNVHYSRAYSRQMGHFCLSFSLFPLFAFSLKISLFRSYLILWYTLTGHFPVLISTFLKPACCFQLDLAINCRRVVLMEVSTAGTLPSLPWCSRVTRMPLLTEYFQFVGL